MNKRTRKVSVKCVDCGTGKSFMVDPEDFKNWENGAVIQRAFPYLADSQLVLLNWKTCLDCWKKNFPNED